jgi:RNA polymerase sigma-70 factor (ECF subfamily)
MCWCKYQHRIVALIGRYIADWSECQDVGPGHFHPRLPRDRNFRGDAQFYTWLHRIAVNTAKNYLAPTTAVRPPTTSMPPMPSSSTWVRACATATRPNAS